MTPKRGKHPRKECWWPKPGGQSAERGAYGRGQGSIGGDPRRDKALSVGEPVAKLGHAESCSKGESHSRPERSERVLDLMGHIGGELFVAVDPIVERRDHAAEGAR